MPIYEYHCSDCDTTFEQRRTFAQIEDPQSCPACESLKTERVPSSFMFAVSRANGAPAAGTTTTAGCGCGGACACSA